LFYFCSADFVANSAIIKDAKEAETLHGWVQEATKTNVKFELLWKGSRDGFKAATFHSKCNDKGPTVTVIKSEHNNVFGGFTSEAWTGSCQNKHDPTAFIYSLTKKGKYAQQLNKNSIRDYSGNGPMFGNDRGYCDIVIGDNCDTSGNNQCIANCTYQLPSGADDSFLAGSVEYSVKEIEVYAVKTV